MTAIILVFALAVIGLLGYAVYEYRVTYGTTADKLAAAWGDSMTIFVLAWGMILSFAVQGADAIAQVSGDPDFGKLADSIGSYIPPQYHGLILPTTLAAGIVARLRTLGK